MQEARDRNADGRQNGGGLLIDPHRLFADIVRPDSKNPIHESAHGVRQSRFVLKRMDLRDEVFSIDKPDLAKNDECVGRKNDSKRGNC